MSAYAPAVARLVNSGVPYHDEVIVRQAGRHVLVRGGMTSVQRQKLRNAGYTIKHKPWGAEVRRPVEGDGIGDPT